MAKTITRFLRRGGAAPLLAGLLTLALLAWMGANSLMGSAGLWPRAHARARRDPLPPTADELAVTLTRLGLDARTLAAAGVTTAEAAALIARASNDLQSRIQAIRDGDNTWATNRAQVDRLERRLSAGVGTEQDVADLATARTALASSATSRQAALDGFLAAALDGLDAGKAATLATLRTNEGQWDLPTQYLAGTHGEADWVNLRDAVANDRISTRDHVDPDPVAHQVIVSALADPNVSAANSNLTNGLTDVTAAWNSAVFGH